MFPDEEPNLIVGWDELTKAGFIDLCEAVKVWVRFGRSKRVRLCDEHRNCEERCPACIVHPVVNPMDESIYGTAKKNSLCNAMSAELLTPDEALVLVEHEMDKRGMKTQ